MKRIKTVIEGVSPLICNKFTDAAMESATKGSRRSTNGDKGSPMEQAEQKLYIGHEGKPMIPNPNLFRSIMDGGVFFKTGKRQVTTQKTSIIPACLFIEETEIPIEHKDPWRVDTRAVRNPNSSGRIATHRPMFDDWRLTFNMTLDDSIIGIQLLREVVDAAGSRIGLGDFRPSCKGPYGRYKVVSWEVVDLDAEARKDEQCAVV